VKRGARGRVRSSHLATQRRERLNNTIRYVPIRKLDLEILCNGALPRQYSVLDHMRMFCGMKPRGKGSI
jgi:hypothetical protein